MAMDRWDKLTSDGELYLRVHPRTVLIGAVTRPGPDRWSTVGTVIRRDLRALAERKEDEGQKQDAAAEGQRRLKRHGLLP
jgi:hypothetical protein